MTQAKTWLREGDVRNWDLVKRNWKLTSVSRMEALQKGVDEPAPNPGKKRRSILITPRGFTETKYFQDYKIILQQPNVLDLVSVKLN